MCDLVGNGPVAPVPRSHPAAKRGYGWVVGLANDLGLCKSCGADLATHFDEREHSFRHTQVLPIPGLAGALRVAPAKALTFPQLLYYGQPLVREKGVFRVETEGRPILVRLKRGFVDPYPTVLVDGVKLPYGDPLPWYATLLAFLPTIFMVGAGCLGIALGAISTGYCLKALRTGKTRFARFGVPLIINGVTIPLGGALLIMKVLAFAPPDIALTHVDAGRDGACGLDTDGTLHCTFQGVAGTFQAGSANDWVSIVGPGYPYCALNSQGAVGCFVNNGSNNGFNSSPAIDPSSGWSQLVSGDQSVCGLRNGTERHCRGYRQLGSLGDGFDERVPTAVVH